jgi:hypothetical protein
MANYAISRQERIYLFSETTFGTIPTVVNASCSRHINAGLMAVVNNYPRPDKTGTRSQVIGLLGRKSATWNLSMSLAGNGTAGTVPDCAPILRALFGVAGGGGTGETIVGATSVTYALQDPSIIPSLSIYSFRTPATETQRIVLGAVVAEATFTMGQNIATWSANGTGIWCLDTETTSNQTTFNVAGNIPDATQKGGLATFPVEPAAPVTNGAPTVGFTGSATFDGTVIAEIQSATLRVRTGSVVATDTFGSYYPVLAEGEQRTVGLAFTVYDSDGAGIKNLKAKAQTQTPMTVTLVMGTIGGNIWTFTLNNVQIAQPSYDDSRNRYMCVFPESMAHATSITVRDEITLALT